MIQFPGFHASGERGAHFSCFSVLDHTKSGFVTIGYNTEIVALRPHRKSFFVDVADSPRCDVCSLEQPTSFGRAGVSIWAEAFGFGVPDVLLHHVRVGEWVKIRIVHPILDKFLALATRRDAVRAYKEYRVCCVILSYRFAPSLLYFEDLQSQFRVRLSLA